MSDDTRDPVGSAGDQGGTEPQDGGLELDDDLSGITDPALAARLETIHRSMATLGMRIESLATSTTSYRAALTDRLNEYAELVSKLTRSQASELEEYRRANETALSELRRSLTTSEASIERVGARIDALVGEAESTDDASRRALAEVRSILDAQESLGRFLTESLDKFADDVRADESGSVSTLLDELRETMQDLASGEVMGALWDEFRQLRATLDDLVARVDAAVEAEPGPEARLPDEVARLNEAVRTLLDQAVVDGDVDDDAAADPGLESLLADVQALRAELADGLVVEADGELGVALDELRRDVGGLGGRLDELVAAATVEDDDTAEGEADRLGPQLERLGWRLDEISNRLDDLAARLEQPLELAEAPDVGGEALAELADQLASLRDYASAEFTALRERDAGESAELAPSVDLTPLTARLDRLHDELQELQEVVPAPSTAAPAPELDLDPVHDALADIQAALATLLDRPATAAASGGAPPATDGYAAIDPDVVDLLREEIRASGEPAAGLIEALNTELKALRRRIRLRAEGEIFSDDQLEAIAASVARRLADEK